MIKQKRVAIAVEVDQPYPHHHDVYLGIQRYAMEHRHWTCLIDEHPGFAMHRRKKLVAGYDGVIARASKTMQRRLKRAGVPLVNVMYASHTKGLAGVYLDTAAAGRQAADHLIDRGFARLVAIVERSYRQSRRFAQAFASCADESGVACKVFEIDEGVYRDTTQWLRFEKSILEAIEDITPPTGLFITNPSAARLVVQHVQARGLQVPHDLAVICQHNVNSILGVPPQITSIDSNLQRAGYEAAVLLEAMMDGQPPPDKPVMIPPKGVIVRESTDFFAVEDELVAAALVFISSRLTDKLRVDGIAYAMNVSTRLLQMRFDQALGISVSDEVRRLRFEKAKRLLAEPDRLIGSIPEQVGFATLNVMNQVFHREIGMSPGAFRKTVLGKT